VAVVIPVHGHLALTLRCLDSLARATGTTPFEVLVVDDASPDGTREALAEVAGLRVLALDDNVGYLRAVNTGTQQVDTPYLCLLNNDLEVEDGWLDALVRTLDEDPGVGLVGSLQLDIHGGSVQEAGGAIFRDGRGYNYGRGDLATANWYQHSREVDYCSAAAVLVRTALWRELGGFDERFAPSYYEDTDLSFALRARGHRVVYQPASRVRHYEGGTHGTDETAGGKSHLDTNREQFVEKWGHVLTTHEPDVATGLRARDRHPGPRVLVLDAQIPEPDRDSGSVRMSELLRGLVRAGARPTLVATDGRSRPESAAELRAAGVEVLTTPIDVVGMLESLLPELVVLSRPDVAMQWLVETRRHAPLAVVAYDTVDLHHVRLARRAALDPDDTRAAGLARTYELLELALVGASDVTLTVSEPERRMLRERVPGADVRVVSNVHAPRPLGPGFAARDGVLFVGNHRHPPNTDAARHLAADVMPLVRARVPGMRLVLAGNEPPASVRALADELTDVPGWVPDLTGLYAATRVVVAPLRYGAGVKGKVGEAMSHGVPCVLSETAAEGMGLVHGEHALIGRTPEELAACLARLHSDRALWGRLAAAGRAHVEAGFGRAVLDEALRTLLDDVARARRGAAARLRPVPATGGAA
jgi:GT2 family glycosyltransferase